MDLINSYNKIALSFIAFFIFSGFYEYFYRVYGVSSLIILTAAAALAVFYIFYKFPTFLKSTPTNIVGLVFCFFAFAPMSLIYAEYYLDLGYLFQTIQYFALGAAIGIYIALNKKSDVKFFLFLSLLGCISGVVLTLLGFIDLTYLRVTGFYNNANFMALHLSLFGLLSLMSFKNVFFKALIIFLTTLMLFFTFSRSGMACWLVCLIVYVIASTKNLRIILPLIVLGLIFIPLFLNFATNADYLSEGLVNDRLNISFSNKSFAERVYLLEKSFEVIEEFKIFGYGPGYTFSPNWGFRVSTHNIFLLVFIEYGILGFSLFLLILLSTFINITSSNLSTDERASLIAAFSFLIMQGFFSHNFFDALFFFFYIFFVNYFCKNQLR